MKTRNCGFRISDYGLRSTAVGTDPRRLAAECSLRTVGVSRKPQSEIRNPKSEIGFLAIATFLTLCALSPAAWAGDGAPAAKMSAAVEAYSKATRAVVGVCATDLRTGKDLLSIREKDLFIPASNQKLLTAATALARLSADYKFVTQVCPVGDDLWVFGSGDPTFGDPVLAEEANATIYDELDRWAAAVKKALPNGVAGNLVVCKAFRLDQTVAQESFRHPDWPKDQYNTWYCAPAAALNFNDNCLDVTFRLAKGKIIPSVVPQSRFIQVANKITVGPKHLWSLRYSAGDSVVTLTGTASASSTTPMNVPVNDPLLLTGRVLADRLERAGVKIGGSIVTADAPPDGASAASLKPICQTAQPLPVVLRRTNKHSLNMAAESVFLRAGDGTWAGSAKIMAETLQKHFGLDAGSLVVRDGGGLSRQNRVAPQAVVKVLAAVAARKDAKALADSLPVAGTDGTLERRMTAPPYRGRVLAKTGYILGVSCLSGYVLDKHGRPAVAFSILAEKVPSAEPCRKLQDSLCRAWVDWLDGNS